MTELQFSDHFQCYELLLADIVELIPTDEQKEDLKQLLKQHSDVYCFANAEDITSLGINTECGDLRETIADHSKKIIQENEGQLIKISNVGKIYKVNI